MLEEVHCKMLQNDAFLYNEQDLFIYLVQTHHSANLTFTHVLCFRGGGIAQWLQLVNVDLMFCTGTVTCVSAVNSVSPLDHCLSHDTQYGCSMLNIIDKLDDGSMKTLED